MKNFVIVTMIILSGCMACASEIRIELYTDSYIVDSKVLRINCYIRNTGDKDVAVVAGKILTSMDCGEFVVYEASIRRASSGELVKPTPNDLDIVLLSPKQIVQIGVIDKVYDKNYSGKYKVFYKIPEALLKFYNVWVGEIQSDVKPAKGVKP